MYQGRSDFEESMFDLFVLDCNFETSQNNIYKVGLWRDNLLRFILRSQEKCYYK